MTETDREAALDPAPTARVTRWIEEAVIGLRLCPFATSPWRAGQVRIAMSAAVAAEDAVKDALDEAFALLEAEPDAVATTLVVFPAALDDFEAFLDAAATVEHILEQAGARGVLQVATFHPRFRFEDAGEHDLGNWTNRAPYPVMHLLREAQLSEAIDNFPDTATIPEDNVERLEAMGRAAVTALWGRF